MSTVVYCRYITSRENPMGSGLYSCCFAARIRDQLDRRSSGKSGVKAFSIIFGFATNKIIPDDSLAEGTIYILNNVPKTTSNLPKAPVLPPD
jgi:hypothetical protein